MVLIPVGQVPLAAALVVAVVEVVVVVAVVVGEWTMRHRHSRSTCDLSQRRIWWLA